MEMLRNSAFWHSETAVSDDSDILTKTAGARAGLLTKSLL